MVRAVCLLDTDSHELLDAKLGDYSCGELTLAAGLRGLDHSITLFDRAYFSSAFLLDWQHGGTERHWLMRARDNLRHEVVQTLGEDDWLIRMPVSQRVRQLRAELPSHWQARMIQTQVNGKPRRFITSMLDTQRFTAPQRAAQQAARAGDAGGVGRPDRPHAAAQVHATDGAARPGGARAHQLSHGAPRHRGTAGQRASGACGELARAPATADGRGPALRVATTQAGPQLSS